MDIKDLKTACRTAAFAARKTAHAQGGDKQANAQLISYLKAQDRSLVVAGYMPIRTEVSPLPALRKLYAWGVPVCLPVVPGENCPLEFRAWTPETEMTEGAFGAAIPKADVRVSPDIVITPMLAFDRHGYRMGYGGGYYDRTFAALSAQKPVQAIGFAYADQEVLLVPREPTDHPLTAMITEKGVLQF